MPILSIPFYWVAPPALYRDKQEQLSAPGGGERQSSTTNWPSAEYVNGRQVSGFEIGTANDRNVVASGRGGAIECMSAMPHLHPASRRSSFHQTSQKSRYHAQLENGRSVGGSPLNGLGRTLADPCRRTVVARRLIPVFHDEALQGLRKLADVRRIYWFASDFSATLRFVRRLEVGGTTQYRPHASTSSRRISMKFVLL